jgi:hypothetical protein
MRDTGTVVTSNAAAALAMNRPLRDEMLVDTAINRLEKLRRVFALEEWIRESADNPHLAASCATWSAEREQLLAELQLEGVSEEHHF